MTRIISLCFSLFLASSCLADQQTWYFIRHFEKQQGDDPHLSEHGQQSAHILVTAFEGKQLNKIYSTQYNRTIESASPLATERGLQITIYDPAKLELFAQQIKGENHILIIGHSNTTPQLIRLMGADVADLTEADYGQLFTLTTEQKQVNLSIHMLKDNE